MKDIVEKKCEISLAMRIVLKHILEVELYATEAWSTLGVVPKEDVEKLFANAKFDLPGILELEKETKHDIVAFTRNVSSYLGDEKKWVHYGLTSTDVVDTAYGYLYKQANDILYRDLLNFQEVLKEKALQYKFTPCIGRTHGVHADISSFWIEILLFIMMSSTVISNVSMKLEKLSK